MSRRRECAERDISAHDDVGAEALKYDASGKYVCTVVLHPESSNVRGNFGGPDANVK
jgi:hypothetical protein